MLESTTWNNSSWTFNYRIPRQLCPTCQFVKSGEAMRQGMMCILHSNPDGEKYYCLCDNTFPMTHEEKIKEWGSDPDDYKPQNGVNQ
ncbi:MAG: hypothetical protein KGI08_03595 [Thaumarchaeota archaeon]|nr:hypothetical protein [Nitrososphaerota archaeon]